MLFVKKCEATGDIENAQRWRKELEKAVSANAEYAAMARQLMTE